MYERNEAKEYHPFTLGEFLQAMSDSGLEIIRELESRWTCNRVGVQVCEARYLTRIPGVRGYCVVGSSCNPHTQYSNDNACDRITLSFKQGEKRKFRRLNRVKNWPTNFAKAVGAFREEFSSNTPTDFTSSKQAPDLSVSV